MGSLVVRPAILRFLLCEKVFSIHSVLKVASQNRIFASGVYRQFPAPDFNRLVAMLPRHTVKSFVDSCSMGSLRRGGLDPRDLLILRWGVPGSCAIEPAFDRRCLIGPYLPFY